MRLAWILGIAGLVPMIAGVFAPAFAAFDGAPLQQAAMVYGCIICAFMAGTHWAFAIYADRGRDARLLLSVGIALLAWWFVFLPRPAAGILLAACFALLFAIDSWMARNGMHMPDYWRLRQVLSAGAALSYIGLALAPAA